eukprot:CAMPEP_0202711070 /NCGR_PEP_ID=MMETSP1385-20130828/22940_1 /ASSEMBLY_ACC=CAM_ASM_000861 /TAXON_ID=933848 /ORGANISM="Elphidium margaritaceum" /LENGTH=711 /DNA_ID=CAMNT_0049370733 /DNA_START=76 /DNA_END=2211 /DNA_ORIENTATION=-
MIEPKHTESNHPDHDTDHVTTDISKEKFFASFLKKIRTQYNEELNYDDGRIASKALTTFKHQSHQNTFDELLEALEDHQDEHGYFIDAAENENDDDDLLQTPQASTDEPHTVEDLIIHRHVYELLYNLLLAAHFQMKQRKNLLFERLFANATTKQQKISDIISDFLPTNVSTMQSTIDRIFDDIVGAHYHKSIVFLKTKKTQICSFITAACIVSFEMLISEHELSWFPLLFTDPKTTFIAPVVRYDKVIKKHQKLQKQKQKQKHEKLHRRGRTYSHHKALSELREGIKVSFDSLQAKQILYYTFPGIIDADNDKIYHGAEAFTCATPSIFLRHDLNWIFCKNDTQRLKLKKLSVVSDVTSPTMKSLSSYSSVFEEEEESDEEEEQDEDEQKNKPPVDPYQDILPLCEMQDMQVISKPVKDEVLSKVDFTSKAQLVQDWTTFQRQTFNELCEFLSDRILDSHADAAAACDDQKEYDDDDEDDEDGEEEECEYEANRVAVQMLLDTMMQCRLEMKSRMNAARLSSKYNASYLNMYKLYKYFCHELESTQKISIRTHGIVKNIVTHVYRTVFVAKGKQAAAARYRAYKFVRQDAECKRKLHEFIAECGELFANVFYHEWDVCPALPVPVPVEESDESSGRSKCMQKFDVRLHSNDREKSRVGSKCEIDYVVFPGLCYKTGWHQFDQQYGLNKLDAKQIQEFIKCKIIVCLNDDE